MTLIEYLKTSKIVESDAEIGKKFGVTKSRVSYIRLRYIGKKKHKELKAVVILDYVIAQALEDYVGNSLSILESAEKNKISYEQFSKAISKHWIGKRKLTEGTEYLTLKSKV